MIPSFQTIMRPMLEELSDGEERDTVRLRNELAERFGVSAEERAELLPSGTGRLYDNRVAWAYVHLQHAGAIERVRRGVYRITPRGRSLLVDNPERTSRPPWSDLGSGSWRRECKCTFEVWSAPLVDDRTRLDPYDPTTARHLPQCEYRDEVSPAMLKILLTGQARPCSRLRLVDVRRLRRLLAGSALPPAPHALDAASEVNDDAIRLEAFEIARSKALR